MIVDPLTAAADWFSLNRSGHRTDEDEAAFRAWMAAHEAHRAAYRSIGLSWDALDTIAHAPAILAARAEDLRSHRRLRPSRHVWAATAAAALLAVSTSIAYRPELLPWLGPAIDHVRGGGDVRSGVGQRKRIVLADGSTVILDTDSRIRVRRMRGERLLELVRGRAFFDVAPDPTRPFLIRVGGRTVRALGTTFTVRIDHDDVSVALLGGRVRVEQPGGMFSATRTAEVTAGGRLDAPESGAWTIGRFNRDEETGWTGGRLVFTRHRLIDAVAEMNRYSRRKLSFDGGRVPDRTIIGIFPAGDVEALADAMALAGYARIVRADDRAIVLTAR